MAWRWGPAWAAAATLPLLFAIQATRGALVEARNFRPTRNPVRIPTVLADLAVRVVEFQSEGLTNVRGWYVPSGNHAVVILAHGSGADRTQLAGEARALARDGFGILMFDWPGHGESGGRVTYGRTDRRAFSTAVDYAMAQPDVDRDRIGALGFSVGAALVAETAAEDTRVRALVLVSCFADSDEQTRYQFGFWRPVMQWPAVWVDRVFMPDGPLRPIDAVRALEGRDLLVIAASSDPTVPSWMSAKALLGSGRIQGDSHCAPFRSWRLGRAGPRGVPGTYPRILSPDAPPLESDGS